jgi:glycine/D-amino acid oxidase-like deaminating enzyme
VHRSLWLEDALQRDPGAPAPPLAGAQTADVCIVGGGYTGLWAALRIKELEPACDVVVLEADICGGGASGRNGGFCTTWWSKLATMIKACGVEEALRLGRASQDAVDAIGDFCAEHAPGAYRRAGWLWVATAVAQVGSWEPALRTCEEHGVEAFVRLTLDELHARIDQPTHLAGVWEPATATVQPALLARALRRVALDRGVRIHERSPMVRLRRGRPAVVHTRDGRVEAGSVALALNAWAAAVPELRRVIVPVHSDIVATAPAPGLLERLHWTGGEAIADARLMVHYYRTTPDGRIVFGKGGGGLARGGRIGHGFDHDASRSAWVERHMRSILPGAAGARVTHSWAGPVARTLDGLPVFGRLAPGLVHGGGYAGNGVGPSWVGGRVLASLALDREDEWSGCGLVGPPRAAFPPEPVRYLGGRVVRAAVSRLEAAEDAGRAPRAATRFLAGFAPASYGRSRAR